MMAETDLEKRLAEATTEFYSWPKWKQDAWRVFVEVSAHPGPETEKE